MDKITSITYSAEHVYITYEIRDVSVISDVDYLYYHKVIYQAQELSSYYDILSVKYVEGRFVFFCLAKYNGKSAKFFLVS